jgi:hypothetical protein
LFVSSTFILLSASFVEAFIADQIETPDLLIFKHFVDPVDRAARHTGRMQDINPMSRDPLRQGALQFGIESLPLT